MCHLMLLTPILALPLFWVLPFSSALPIYLILVLVAAGFYWAIGRAMARRVEVGIEGLTGAEGEVVLVQRKGKNARYLVRSKGELWTAKCSETLGIGEKVRIRAQNGVGVLIEPAGQIAARPWTEAKCHHRARGQNRRQTGVQDAEQRRAKC